MNDNTFFVPTGPKTKYKTASNFQVSHFKHKITMHFQQVNWRRICIMLQIKSDHVGTFLANTTGRINPKAALRFSVPTFDQMPKQFAYSALING